MNKTYICETIRKKDGSALLFTVILFLVLVIFVTTAAVVAQGNILRSTKVRNTSSVYYVAETGLNEYMDKFNQWFASTTEDYNTNPTKVISDFAKPAYMAADSVSIDGKQSFKSVDYGQLMNLQATADIELNYTGKDTDFIYFELISTGRLGNEERKLKQKMEMEINIGGGGGSIFDVDALFALDNSGLSPDRISPFQEFNWNKTFEGPFITNRPLIIGGAYLYGPFVTSNNLEIYQTLRSYGAIIVGGNILFNNTSSVMDINALILTNPNSTIKIAGGWNTIKVDHLMLPVGFDFERQVTFQGKGTDAENGYGIEGNYKKMYDQLKANAIYYNPLNFNPWKQTAIPAATIKKIFGEEPTYADQAEVGKYPYDRYFREDFVLNNLDSLDEFYPEIKIPEIPSQGSSSHPWYKTKFPASSLVDNQNNLKTECAVIKNQTLDLTHSVSFKNFVIGDCWGDSNLVLNIGQERKDIEVVVDTLKIGKSYIKVVGNGTLTFYVRGGVGGVVRSENLSFSPAAFEVADTASGAIQKDYAKVKIVVHKSENVTIELNNSNDRPIYTTFISQNLNFKTYRPYGGVFISKEGTLFESGDGSKTITSPLVLLPNGLLKIKDATFSGKAIADRYSFDTAGYRISFNQEYDKEKMRSILQDIPLEDGGTAGSGGSGAPVRKLKLGAVRETGGKE